MDAKLLDDIKRAHERLAQLHSPEELDKMVRGEIPLAASCYCLHGGGPGPAFAQEIWPFAEPFRPYSEMRDNHLAAIAFLVMEIERGDREHERLRD